MMKRLSNFLYVGLIMALAGQMLGQESSKNAELLYNNGNYEEAIDAYMDYLVNNTDDVLATIQLAECYLKTNDLYQANALFAELSEDTDCDPELYVKHGNVLKKMLRFDEAKKVFQKYATTNPNKAKYLISGCDFAESLLENDARCNLENLAFNSKSADFNPQFHNDKLIYASKRAMLQSEWLPKGELNLKKSEGALLYMVENNEPEPFTLKDNKAIEYVDQAVMSNSNNTIAYTKTDGHIDIRVVSSASKEMQIFLTEFNETTQAWEEKAFPYNSETYSVGFPYLNAEGNLLYFASNMPGGYGSFDIYISKLVEGKWQTPINLGNEVNTAGNEITPHVQNSDLFFASDWHQGMGGYDVFRIRKTDNEWAKIENLGACVNSTNDDFGFVVAPGDENKAFFTSNRMGGKGAEDIYAIEDIDELATKVVQTQITEPELPLSLSKSLAIHSNSENTQLAIKGVEIKYDFEKDYMIMDDPCLESVELEPNQKVYFVQIAALSKMKGNLKRFNHFRKYGNVYKVQAGDMIKIRIGFFTTTNEAIRVVKELKRKGIREAFIVGDYLDKARLELIAMASTNQQMESDDGIYYNPNYNSKFKIKVVSYKHPSKFNTANIADLGRIEHWSKNEWRIILLSGYKNAEDARIAMDKLKTRGYKDAYIVIDEEGILREMK